MPTTHGRMRWARRAVIASVAAFALLMSSAMALYPGGTWCDEGTIGHRFWKNYLCDLTWETALGGGDNHRGAVAARAAMVALAVGLGVTWRVASRAGEVSRASRVVSACGPIAVVGMIAVTVVSSETMGRLHGAVVLSAAGPGLLATGLSVHLLARDEPRPRVMTGLGLAMVTVAALDLALYTWHLARPAGCDPWTPLVQKVALAVVLQWMLFVASRAGHLAKRV
jgi:hypothetical protein